MLTHPNLVVKQLALCAIAVLGPLDNVSPVLLTSTIMEQIITMLDDPYSDIREAARNTTLAVIKKSRAFRDTLKAETQRITKMLNNTSWRFKRSALRNIAALIEEDDIRSVIATKDLTTTVITLLADKSWNVRQSALETVAVLAKEDVFRPEISTPATMETIISTLGDKEAIVWQLAQKTVIAFLNHRSFRDSISTPNCLVHILCTLDGSDRDVQIHDIMTKIIGFRKDVKASTIALTRAILDRIVDATPATRKSYTEVVKMLPLETIPIPIKNANKVFEFLNDPDPDIVDSSVEILLCLFVNDEFRSCIPSSILGQAIVKQLQQAKTANSALKMLTGLVKYDMKQTVIRMPGVIAQCLSMYHAEVADIERWQIGFKGLLALGLLK
ncbi:armadillo-type protein [Mycena galericulata]|nr:armadillo-type protein [Mycena galericulata]